MTDKHLSKISKAVRNPEEAIRHLILPVLSGVELAYSSRYPFGTNFLEKDWDLLVVLDTCRVDALNQVQEQTNERWLSDNSIDEKYSIGGSTLEWTAQTFSEGYEDEVGELDFIAGNMMVQEVLDGKLRPEDSANISCAPTSWSTLGRTDFNEFLPAWEYRESRGPDKGHADRPHPSAKTVTDTAIVHGREHNPKRTVVHYIQPHYPYYAAAESAGRTQLYDWERFPFPSLRNGPVGLEKVWNTYIGELKSVVDSIAVLLDNYEAEKAVITSDHGEAFGEWLGYKHRGGTIHPKVRRVPWVEATAQDTETIEPDIDLSYSELSRDEILDALGYI